jgi:cytochrome P450
MNTNTPKTCFWAIAFLFKNSNPAFHDQILAEANSVYDSKGAIDLHGLSQAPALSSLVNEVLRLGSASSSMRVTTSATIIGGKKIPAKARVMVPTRELHMNTTIFGATSNLFQPERFMSGKEDLTKSLSFRPFGGGVTHCPGRFIAQQEIKMMVVGLLRAWNVEIVEGSVVPEMETMMPTTGIMGPRDGDDVLLSMRPR